MAPSAPVLSGRQPVPFGARLAEAMAEHGPVCVGIDPHPALLRAWGLGDDVEGLRRFSLGVVEALGGRVAALKPQSAFFERHGSAGVAVLEEVLAAAAAAGTLTVLDVKRGDIGSTMAGYADAYLRDGSSLAADAVTLSPYLGFGSLRPALDLARQTGRGIFVLALTSNPEGASIQHALDGGVAVAARIAEGAAVENAAVEHPTVEHAPLEHPTVESPAAAAAGDPAPTDVASTDAAARLGSVGLVVGATTGSAVADLGIDLTRMGGAILAPGVGAQGAGARELAEVFGPARRQVLASTSRAVLAAGPEAASLRSALAATVDQAREALQG
ncbi:orotidine-5'-phosphate decarboxylase [Georgenia muralis]|uniref:Orotidine 5'-phosphate decarboxylase n=1 Tax=Georgenia muralis TaxID=154117 RepID=A0A3N4Z842_9MICO|nr:orotidine-5'-phosphate decarboxylase [Georgenia muralis]RPF28463.1 orotidine-5'-phosphate decarboxylase [Georgenia muralis]